MRKFLFATSFLLLAGASVAPVQAQVSSSPSSGAVMSVTDPTFLAAPDALVSPAASPALASSVKADLPVVAEAMPLSLDESAMLEGDGFFRNIWKAIKSFFVEHGPAILEKVIILVATALVGEAFSD